MSHFADGKWSWYWKIDESGETNCGVVTDRGYSICRAPRYMTEEQWAEIAPLLAKAPELLRWLRAIYNDLPSNRDWLDPNLESQIKGILKELE